MNNKTKNILETIAVVLLVVGLGTFALNQVLTFYYNSQFLQTPCELCASLEGNEQLVECFNQKASGYSNPVEVDIDFNGYNIVPSA